MRVVGVIRIDKYLGKLPIIFFFSISPAAEPSVMYRRRIGLGRQKTTMTTTTVLIRVRTANPPGSPYRIVGSAAATAARRQNRRPCRWCCPSVAGAVTAAPAAAAAARARSAKACRPKSSSSTPVAAAANDDNANTHPSPPHSIIAFLLCVHRLG